MLQQMRTGAKSIFLKFILFGLLVLATIGLAFMDVQGMFRQGVSDSTVAKVGDEKITAPEFDRMVQTALRNQGLKQQEAYLAGFPRMVLEQEINNRLFALEARKIGLQVDDALAAAELKKILEPLKKEGLSDKAALDQLLRAYDMSEPQLVSILKSQIATQNLFQTAFANGRASEQLKVDAARYRSETREGRYVILNRKSIKDLPAPTEEELRAFYETVSREYVTPEYRSLSVIVLDAAAAAKEVKTSPDAIKAHYDEHISDYSEPEKRTVSQAVAKDEKLAKELLAKAQQETSLEKATKSFEKEKVTFVKAGDFTQSEMAAELAEAAFAAKAGEIIGPLKSPLGWHVLHVEKTSPAVITPFEKVSKTIEEEILRDLSANALYDRANKIDDAVAGGKPLADIAREYGIDITTIPETDSFGKNARGTDVTTSLPAHERVLEQAFSLSKGAASSLIETPEGSFVLVSVDNITPAEKKSFEKIKTDVRERFIADRQMRTLQAEAEKIVERVKAGEKLDKIAAEKKEEIRSTGAIQRGKTPEESKIDRPLLNALFSLAKTGEATFVNREEEIVVLSLHARKIEASQSLKDDLDTSVEEVLNRSVQQSLMDQYRTALAKKYKVTVNDALIARVYSPADSETLE